MRGSYTKPAPKRLMTPPSREKKSPLRRLGLVLYFILFGISAVIVAVYLAFTLFVSEPEVVPPPVQQQPNVPAATQPAEDPGEQPGAQEQPTQPQAEPLERREGVYNIFLAGADAEGYRTDTMMIVSYDTKAQTVGVVSIPRDTIVDRGEGENPKLVYGKGGVDARRQEISEMLGIPIDYYIKINLQAFVAVVDQLGGVDFYVPCDMNYDDPAQDLHIHYTEGMQHLNGQQVMEVARFRQNNEDENGNVTGYSDIGRTQTQQKLLVALAKKVLSWNSLTSINNFVEIFKKYVYTDLELNDMLYLASKAIYVDIGTGVKTATLTGDGFAKFRGHRFCFELDQQHTLDTVNELINPYTRELTLDDMKLVSVG